MKKLTSKMMRAAEMSVANPEMSCAEIARQLGVDPSTLWRWQQDDKYKEYQHQLCIERFRDLEKLAIKKLKENANNNNQKAIEYILDYMGFKAAEQQEIELDAKIEVDYGED